jgi:hypothetical protein
MQIVKMFFGDVFGQTQTQNKHACFLVRFWVSLCVLDGKYFNMFFSVFDFGQTPKHVFLSAFLRFCTVFAI